MIISKNNGILQFTQISNSKYPFQKSIHESPGNWFQMPWDPQSTLWKPLVFNTSIISITNHSK